jgi:hypothetical protein
MAETWATVQASGRGKLIYLLEILGIGVLMTYKYTPTDSWYTTHWNSTSFLHDWLVDESLPPIQESIDFMEARCDVDSITLEIADVGAGMTGLLKDFRAHNTAWLASTLSSAETTAITVDDTSAFASSGDVYIGHEVIGYTGKTGTTFTTLTRGKYGTVAREHYVDLTGDLPEGPVVADGAHFLTGRRAILHAAVLDPGTGIPGATTIIYRGRITKGMKVGKGKWDIEIEHISNILKEKVATAMPQSNLLQGYYYSGSPAATAGGVSGNILNITTSTTATTTNITVDEGWYSPSELMDEWNAQVRTAGPSIEPVIFPRRGKYAVRAPADTGKRTFLRVARGDPLWALGFEAGLYFTDYNQALAVEAQNEARLAVVDFTDHGRWDTRPSVEVEDATVFTVGLMAQVPGFPFAEVASASGTTVEFDVGSLDTRSLGSVIPDPRLWIVEDEDDMILRHVFTFSDIRDPFFDISESLQRMLYLESSQSEPEYWCAIGALPSTHEHGSDFDFDELDDLLVSVPSQLRNWSDALNEGKTINETIGGALAMLGICPRLTSANKIGFVRARTPITSDAVSPDVDSDMWAVDGAAESIVRIDGTPVVNTIIVEHSHRYTQESGGGGGGSDKGWGAPIKIVWRQGINMIGKVRSAKYKCRGIITSAYSGSRAASVDELAEVIDRQIRASHFGLFGRESSTVALATTWTSKQILCGDVVKVTHPLIPDITEGTIGVTNRLGVVVSKIGQLEGGKADTLSIMFLPDANVAGIAPCAHGDSWTVGTLTMGFSGAATPSYAPTGENDLDYFAAADDVLLIERNVSSPSTWTATIDSVSAPNVVFTADPFSGAGIPATGVYMVIPDWDSASATQQAYAYVSDVAAVPSLGSGSDAFFEWGV